MITPFIDHFSSIASTYADFRPSYPDALFEWLAKIAPAPDVAWDCACGNGQASRGLAEHFKRVIATDASKEQIAAAKPHDKIKFHVATAESSGLVEHTVDLVTVATAIHWFDFEKFYTEVRRVAKPAAVIAAWTYGLLNTSDNAVNAHLSAFYERMESYWPPERHYVSENYRTIPFPFPEIEAPVFNMEASWNLVELLGYFRTWSSVRQYVQKHQADPVIQLEADLKGVWGDPEDRKATRWPLAVRAGRIE